MNTHNMIATIVFWIVIAIWVAFGIFAAIDAIDAFFGDDECI